MKVSVLINCKNRQAELDRLLESLSGQNGVGFEIIVLDDGSEKPLQVATGARLFRKDKSLGVGGGRNFLARQAVGDYLLFLDDDTELTDPLMLEYLVASSAKYSDKALIASCQLKNRQELHSFQPARSDVPVYCRRFLGYGFFVPRKVWVETGGFWEPFGYQFEEPELSWRLLDLGYSVVYDPGFKLIHYFAAGLPEQVQAKHENICRNMCAAVLLRANWYLLPFFMAWAVSSYLRFSSASRAQKYGGVFRAFRRLVPMLPDIFRDRKPLRLTTWRSYFQLGQAGVPVS